MIQNAGKVANNLKHLPQQIINELLRHKTDRR